MQTRREEMKAVFVDLEKKAVHAIATLRRQAEQDGVLDLLKEKMPHLSGVHPCQLECEKALPGWRFVFG